ncbi:LysR substrate-binding domain-containing protein [uncultured Paracoccus sp.]|uniref:LysR substrate-binding domain-containing protein n=1 Tax=uncultured Paracoccus sp. TaxID=189685 RepID=UPI0025E196D5|nr:LysR substrate-binding domain-containing protein [uncultured Paracoccus sp.]
MNYLQIRAFHLVALEGSVRRAAEVMGVSQPTVSQHLKGLEERHGVRLFQKRGRGLALTELGAQLFNVTGPLLDQAGAVEDLLNRRDQSATGRLRIISDSPPLVVRIVRRLLTDHPGIAVSIRKASVDAAVEALTELRADIAIAVDPLIGTPLQITPLWTERLHACLPAGHPLAQGASFPMAAVADQTLIQREKGSRTRALIERALLADAIAPARVIEVEGAEVVREAVALSLGVSFFARSECPPDPRLRYLPAESRQGRTTYVENVMVRRERRNEPAIRNFILAARAECGTRI